MNPREHDGLARPQLEALARVATAGAVVVSSAMTSLTRRRVSHGQVTVLPTPITGVADLLGGAEARVVALHMRIEGVLRGEILIGLSPGSAGWLLASILGTPEPPQSRACLAPLDESALLEIGNTMAGCYLNALSETLGAPLMISIPGMAIDMAGAVVDDLLAETARGASRMLVIGMPFTADLPDPLALMLHLPDPGTLPLLLAALGRGRGGRQGKTACGV